MSLAVDKVFLNNPGKKGFAFYDFVKDEKKKNNCPLKIELSGENKSIFYFSFHLFFQPSAVVPLTSQGLLAEPL